MKILAIGPYIGSLEQEIINFRPYAKWLSNVMEYDELFLSTHHNRLFLYEDLKNCHLLPIDERLSSNIMEQTGFINIKITQKEYSGIVDNFKKQIVSLGYKKKQIENISLKYRKILTQYPSHRKIFTPIKTKNSDKLEMYYNKICFIPYNMDQDLQLEMYNEIKCNVVVLDAENCDVLKDGYLDVGYTHEDIFSIINNAKAIITPLCYHTLVANLQKKKVYSWGECVSMYREDGIYNMNNKYCKILPDMNMETLINSIKRFINEI